MSAPAVPGTGVSCGYCDGTALPDPDRPGRYVHAADGYRVGPATPGDYVTDRHNRAGTPVDPADVIYAPGPV